MGTHTAPSLKATHMLSNRMFEFRLWTRMRSLLPIPWARRASTAESTRRFSSDQVQTLSPCTRPGRSGSRRAALVRKWPRFITGVMVMASLHSLKDADVVGHGGPTHVEDARQLGVWDLHAPGGIAQLHGGQGVHRNAGGADRMALGLQPTRGVDRQAPVLLCPTLLNGAPAL